MSTQKQSEFESFMSNLLETHVDLDYFTDFEKCNKNVRNVALKLTQLNYLIGKTDMEQAVRDLWEENSKVFSVLGILIAVRTKDKKKIRDEYGEVRPITSYFDSVEGVVHYLAKTGLTKTLQEKQITNLVDYVFGIEVGQDTNARKNRSGHVMENLVASMFKENGVSFRKEVYSTEFSLVNSVLGKDLKRFDFVVETTSKTYLIETNFYSGGGSKPNEVARAYIELAEKVNACPGYEFVWITDGIGWNSARGKLEEAFYAIPSVYNLTTIKDFIARIKA